LGDNTTEIKHRISETIKAINDFNSIWCQTNITKNIKLYIYQTVIESILICVAEEGEITAREINRIVCTEMDVLRISARN
jgi:hypothetical protein